MQQTPSSSKKILLIITGGIAAYKSLLLIREFQKPGCQVHVILTKEAQKFVTPLSVSTLSGNEVYDNLFSATLDANIGHIELSRQADVLLVAPATANILAKMANGLADDLASTCLLATDKPVIVAPAMNVRMWHHPATQENLKKLQQRGVVIIGPDEGEMACGEFGLGRMTQPQEIKAQTLSFLDSQSDKAPSQSLHGLRVLVTAGPTYEPIDPVRFLGNRSSGKQGYAIAEAFVAAGANVTLISGPTSLSPPKNVDTINVTTAQEMLDMCLKYKQLDIAVFCAAVSDFYTEVQPQKIKKQNVQEPLTLKLLENPDILATISKSSNRPRLVIGFAAETENMMEYAKEKRLKKGCDWIIANNVSSGTNTFGGQNNQVTLIGENYEDAWPLMDKQAVAKKLVKNVIDYFRKDSSNAPTC